MNVFSFTGNIGKEAEIRHTANGDAVTGFNVAVKSGYGQNEKTVWVKCSLFGKRGEAVAPYLLKGQQVAVSGELSVQEWTNKEGEKVTDIAVRANDVTLVGGKKDVASGNKDRTSDVAPNGNKPKFSDDDADSIPF